MVLHNSWQAHLNAKNACDAANRNFGAFIKAIGNDKTKNDNPQSIVGIKVD
jgi:hypothetical protein